MGFFSAWRQKRRIRKKLVRVAWWSSHKAAAARLASALESEAGAKQFDSDWFKALVARRDDLRRTQMRILVASLIPVGYLALTVLGVSAGTTLFGFSLGSPERVFELALVLTSILGAVSTPIGMRAQQADAMIAAWATKTAGIDRSALYLHAYTSTAMSLPHPFRPPGDSWAPSLATRLYFLVWGAATYLALGGLLVCAVLVQILAIYRVVSRPGEPEWLSYTVGAFAVVVLVMDVLMHCIFAWPARFEDYSTLAGLTRLADKSPRAFKEQFQKLMLEAGKAADKSATRL